MSAAEAVRFSSRATVHAAGARPRILLVDDDEPVLNALRRTLGRGSWEVEATTQLDRARELLTRHAFDLVISDQNMPNGTGIDLCRWLRGIGGPARGWADDAAEAIQEKSSVGAIFVLLTAIPEPLREQDLSRLQIAAVLGKPWDCPGLREAVRSLVEPLCAPPAVSPESGAR